MVNAGGGTMHETIVHTIFRTLQGTRVHQGKHEKLEGRDAREIYSKLNDGTLKVTDKERPAADNVG